CCFSSPTRKATRRRRPSASSYWLRVLIVIVRPERAVHALPTAWSHLGQSYRDAGNGGLAVWEDGAPNWEHVAYYARRARGRASLIMTEGVYIDHVSSGDNPLLGRFHGDHRLSGSAYGRRRGPQGRRLAASLAP